jgi:hypothetical protein
MKRRYMELKRGIISHTIKEGRLTGLVTSFVGTAL